MGKLASASESLSALPATTEKSGWRVVAIGAVIVVVITIGFFLLFFNRFAGVRVGNGVGLGGSLILSGRIPYLDFYRATPPLFQLESALITWLFGTALIVQRIVGVLERALLATILYLWLSRLFRTSSAALGAIVAIVVSAGDTADPIASYNHDTILWAVVAGLFASICLKWKSNRTASAAAFLCGISAGLCFCDKQTIGLGITVCVPILVALSLWRERGLGIASRFTAWFCAGWAVPVASISYWLYSHGALEACIRQIFFKGPSAKAGKPLAFVVRWVVVTLGTPSLLAAFIIATVLLILAIRLLFYPTRMQAKPDRDTHTLALVATLSAASIGLGAAAAYAGLTPWEPVEKSPIYFSLLGCGLLAAVFSLGFLFGKLSELQRQFWLLGTVGFVCAFMLSLSWPAFEAMTIPGLGFLVAAFLDSPSRRARAACYLASAILLFSLVVWKLWNPAAFNDWAEPPVMAANTTPSLPALWGFRLPKPEVTMLEGATRIIREHSTPQDKIFTYPTMPIFYALSHRWWVGFAINHNIDVCPDALARADAARVLKAKPAVIVFYHQNPIFLRSEEALWRNQKKFGQLAIISAVEELVKHYKLAASYPAPPTDLRVDVYVRDSSGATRAQAEGNAHQ